MRLTIIHNARQQEFCFVLIQSGMKPARLELKQCKMLLILFCFDPERISADALWIKMDKISGPPSDYFRNKIGQLHQKRKILHISQFFGSWRTAVLFNFYGGNYFSGCFWSARNNLGVYRFGRLLLLRPRGQNFIESSNECVDVLFCHTDGRGSC